MDEDRFRRYAEEFTNSLKIVARGIKVLETSNGNADTVISSSVEIEGELSEAEGYIRAMDVEFRTMSSVEKRGAQQKVTEYKEQYRETLQKFSATKANAEAQALKGGPNARAKLISANQKLDQSTAMLEQSRQVVAQTEQIGNTVLTDLENQREILEDAHDKVVETRGFTSDAKSVLRMMGFRAVYHKVCMIFTILVLAGVIGVIVYFGFLKKK